MKSIDTFDIAKQAKDAGFNAKQTEFLINTVNTIEATHISNLATKNDLSLVEEKLKNETSNVRKDLKVFVLANTITIIAVITGIMALFFSSLK